MVRSPSTAAERLGEIAAQVRAQDDRLDNIERTLRDDRSVAAEDRRLILAKLDALGERMQRMEPTVVAVQPLPAKVAVLEAKTTELEILRAKWGAVITVAGTAVTLIGGGIWYLANNFWADVVASISRHMPKS